MKRKVLYTSIPDDNKLSGKDKLHGVMVALIVCSLPIACIVSVLILQGKLP